MKSNKIVRYVALLGIIVLVGQCTEKINFENIDVSGRLSPGIAMPLVKGAFTIKDRVQDGDTLFVEENDTLKLVISQSIDKPFSASSFNFLDKSNVQNVEVGGITANPALTATIPPFSMPISQTQSFPIPLTSPGSRLDSVVMNSGNFRIRITSSYKHVGRLIISSNGVRTTGGVLNRTIEFGDVSGTYDETTLVPLDGNTLIFTNADDTAKLAIDFSFDMDQTPGVGIDGSEGITVEYNIEGLNDYRYIFGYMGQIVETIDTIIDAPLDQFGNLVDGSVLKFTNPEMSIEYTNSFGMDIGTKFRIVPIFADNDSAVLQPDSSTIKGLTAANLNGEINDAIKFNRNTISNIDSLFIFPPPTQLHIAIEARTNPENDNSVSNFMRDDSQMEFGLDIEIPLELYADLIYSDTIDFPVDVEDVENLEFAEIHYEFTNEFPLEFDIEMVPYDTINNILYTQNAIKFTSADTTKPFLRAAPVDENGAVILDEVETYTDYITISKEQYDVLRNETDYKAILNVYLKSTKDADNVKILSSYKLNYKLGINVQATVAFGD